VGYRVNDPYTAYLAMNKPGQLTKQQVEQLKKQNDGSPVFTQTITLKGNGTFMKELDLRENDVYFLNLIK
jgi:xylan 1,4-beta-xylosidase